MCLHACFWLWEGEEGHWTELTLLYMRVTWRILLRSTRNLSACELISMAV